MSKNKGYTLVEVLVVLAIVGIIASVGWEAFSGGGSNYQHQPSDYYQDHQQHKRYEE